MTRADWLTVILKAMGVYFVVSGFTGFGSVLYTYINMMNLDAFKNAWVGHLLSYIIELIAGFLLMTRTSAFLRWCDELPAPN